MSGIEGLTKGTVDSVVPIHPDASAPEPLGHHVVVAGQELAADVVLQDLDLLAPDLSPARVVADHGDDREAVASEGVDLGQAVAGGQARP